MTDRDTFAAAALTGLLGDTVQRQLSVQMTCVAAYKWADAMLRERENPRAGKNDAETVQEATKCTERETDHDAAPAARARDATASRESVHPGGDAGTGNTQTAPPCVETDGPPSKGEGLNKQEPVAWAVIAPNYSYVSLFRDCADASADEEGGQLVPLYRSPTLTAEEREAVLEACDEGRWFPKQYHYIHTLRSLLERMK